MSARQRTRFAAEDPDYVAIFAAVNMILFEAKPKRRAQLIDAMQMAAAALVFPGGPTPLPATRRAADCLGQAVRRWCALNRIIGD
jgi:hypothetical protein